jgi:hypothetical protein
MGGTHTHILGQIQYLSAAVRPLILHAVAAGAVRRGPVVGIDWSIG